MLFWKMPRNRAYSSSYRGETIPKHVVEALARGKGRPELEVMLVE